MSDEIAPSMSDNEALRRCVADLDYIIRLIGGDYTSIPGTADIAVTDTETAIRAANADALKTVVVNTGDEKVYLYEAGKLVATVYPEQTWESAITGAAAITGKCAAGKTTTVDVATYQL